MFHFRLAFVMVVLLANLSYVYETYNIFSQITKFATKLHRELKLFLNKEIYRSPCLHVPTMKFILLHNQLFHGYIKMTECMHMTLSHRIAT